MANENILFVAQQNLSSGLSNNQRPHGCLVRKMLQIKLAYYTDFYCLHKGSKGTQTGTLEPACAHRK